MKFNNKILVIILSLLAIVNLFLTLIIFREKPSLQIKNTSKHYEIIYEKSPEFEEELESWGVWKRSELSFLQNIGGGEKITISNITIRTTDTLHSNYSYRVLKSEIDHSPFSNYSLSFSKKTAILDIYFDSEALNLQDLRHINSVRTILAIGILTSFYKNLAQTSSTERTYLELMQKYTKSNSSFPFTLRRLGVGE